MPPIITNQTRTESTDPVTIFGILKVSMKMKIIRKNLKLNMAMI